MRPHPAKRKSRLAGGQTAGNAAGAKGAGNPAIWTRSHYIAPMASYMTIEGTIRIAAFALFFSAFALWVVLAPRRVPSVGRWRRWPNNLGVLIVDILTVRVLVPTAAVGAALYASGN